MTARIHGLSGPLPTGLAGRKLIAEVRALIGALAAPNRLIEQVQAMGRLLAEAQRIDARDPARAQDLRRQASRIVR